MFNIKRAICLHSKYFNRTGHYISQADGATGFFFPDGSDDTLPVGVYQVYFPHDTNEDFAATNEVNKC